MTDIPPPDLLDQRGRMNRILIALGCGIAAAAAAYVVTYHMAGADYERGTPGLAQGGGSRGAGRFIFYMTGLAFAVVFSIVLAVLNYREKQKWKADGFPSAKIKK